MKMTFEYKEKMVNVSLQPSEVTLLWDMLDQIEDRKYYLGETWPAERRFRPEKIMFIVEAKDDRRNTDAINEARHQKKVEFEKKQMKEQREAEAAAWEQFRRKNASRRGMSVESENITRAEMEKRAKRK